MIEELPTPHGPARAHVQHAEAPRGSLVLGHGAGGGVDAPDVLAAAAAALAAGFSVARVEQPYRVAGRRSAPAAPTLDAAWVAVVERLRAVALPSGPLVVGGRSSGARVACRTATAAGARAVLCLAFPLLAPARAASTTAPTSRLPELAGAGVAVLVVQGERDRFGIPPAAPGRDVVVVRGDHGLRTDVVAVATAVGAWLRGIADRPAG